MRCLRSMIGLTRRDRRRNEKVRRRTGVLRPLDQKVDEKVLRWFGHVERMNEKRLLSECYFQEQREGTGEVGPR